jgi:SAM-dependent methyltransferase
MADMLIKEFYTDNVRSEWRRLVKNAYHRLEFDTTLHFLNRYLPENGWVLDAGGGPGRYTLELAKNGYQVTLLDFTQANLDFATRMLKRYRLQAQVKQIVQGSIVDLSKFPDASFDSVLCSGGPLSHILHGNDRRRAVSELVRVAKPGAPIFVSVISRFGVIIEILKYSQLEIGMPHFQQICDSGDYLGGSGFTACHFFFPEELRQDFSRPDLEILEMAGLEGIATQHMKELNQIAKDKNLFNPWLKLHLQTCTHPSVVGMSEHILIVCRKR